MNQIPSILQSSSAPFSSAQQLTAKIQQLQTMLLSTHPQMPSLLREIWMTLKKDDELVYLLKEEDIAVIVDGLEKQSQIQIVQDTVKNKATKSLKNMTLDDLGM